MNTCLIEDRLTAITSRFPKPWHMPGNTRGNVDAIFIRRQDDPNEPLYSWMKCKEAEMSNHQRMEQLALQDACHADLDVILQEIGTAIPVLANRTIKLEITDLKSPRIRIEVARYKLTKSAASIPQTIKALRETAAFLKDVAPVTDDCSSFYIDGIMIQAQEARDAVKLYAMQHFPGRRGRVIPDIRSVHRLILEDEALAQVKEDLART